MSKANKGLVALAAGLGSMALMAYLALLARWVRPDPPGQQDPPVWTAPRAIRDPQVRRGRQVSEADQALWDDAVRRANRVL